MFIVGNEKGRETGYSIVDDGVTNHEVTNPKPSKARRTTNTTTTNTTTNNNNIMHSYSANSSSAPLNNNDAFRTLETETSTDRDNFAVLERKFAKDKVTNDSTGLYVGAAGYSTFSTTNQAQIKASKYTGSRGQLRANTTIRTTSRMDYAPDVCKDYRLTGSCGFGDTCVFLHDRTDSKSAQEIESEWEARKKRAQEERDRAVRELEGEAEDGGKPEYKYGFGCMVCKVRGGTGGRSRRGRTTTLAPDD